MINNYIYIFVGYCVSHKIVNILFKKSYKSFTVSNWRYIVIIVASGWDRVEFIMIIWIYTAIADIVMTIVKINAISTV